MKKILQNISVFFGILILGTGFLCSLGINTAEAAGVLDDSYDDHIRSNNDEFVMPREGASSTDEIRRIMYNNILPMFKYLFIFVTLLMWSVYIMNMISAAGNEEEISAQRKNLLWGIVGFMIISLSVELSQIFSPITGTGVEDVAGREGIIDTEGFNESFQKVVTYFQMAIGAVSMVLIFYAGIRFIKDADEDEEITKAKDTFSWGVIGMLIAILVEPLVKTVFYPEDKTLGDEEISNLAVQAGGLLKFGLMFLGIFAVGAFLIAGAYYVTSFGDEERQGKAKTIIGATLLGLVIILSAYTLVSVLVPS